MKPDGSGVADCMKMKEVSVMNVEKEKKKPHRDGKKLILIIAQSSSSCGRAFALWVISPPHPAPPRPLPPPLQVWNPNITWLAVCGCESISLLCCVNALITVSGVKLEKEEKKRRKKKGACRLLARTPDFIFHIKTRWKGGLNFFSNRDAFSTESCEKDVVRKKSKCLIYTCHVAPVWFCVCVWSEHLRVHFYGLLLFSGESSKSVCIYNHTVFSM